MDQDATFPVKPESWAWSRILGVDLWTQRLTSPMKLFTGATDNRNWQHLWVTDPHHFLVRLLITRFRSHDQKCVLLVGKFRKRKEERKETRKDGRVSLCWQSVFTRQSSARVRLFCDAVWPWPQSSTEERHWQEDLFPEYLDWASYFTWQDHVIRKHELTEHVLIISFTGVLEDSSSWRLSPLKHCIISVSCSRSQSCKFRMNRDIKSQLWTAFHASLRWNKPLCKGLPNTQPQHSECVLRPVIHLSVWSVWEQVSCLITFPSNG